MADSKFIFQSDFISIDCGIYCWRNDDDEKKYYGQSDDTNTSGIIVRKKQHIRGLDAGRHDNPYLQRAWKTHPFTHYLVCLCAPEDLTERETYYVNRDNTRIPNGYNILDPMDGRRGMSHTEETKDKIAASKVGKPRSDETKKKLSISHSGKILSDDHKRKIGAAGIGRTYSEETNLKRAESSRKYQESVGRSRVERTCRTCGRVFTVKRSKAEAGKGIYCSKECYDDYQRRKAGKMDA